MATELCLNVRAILRAGVDCGELLEGSKALADIFPGSTTEPRG